MGVGVGVGVGSAGGGCWASWGATGVGAPGDGLDAGEPDGPAGLLPPADLPPGAGAGVPAGSSETTGRKYSLAVCPRVRAWSPFSPGTVMIKLTPSSTTS